MVQGLSLTHSVRGERRKEEERPSLTVAHRKGKITVWSVLAASTIQSVSPKPGWMRCLGVDHKSSHDLGGERGCLGAGGSIDGSDTLASTRKAFHTLRNKPSPESPGFTEGLLLCGTSPLLLSLQRMQRTEESNLMYRRGRAHTQASPTNLL